MSLEEFQHSKARLQQPKESEPVIFELLLCAT